MQPALLKATFFEDRRLILKCIIFMERTGVLIERLLQQYHDNVDAEKMLFTVQLLAIELQQQAATTERQKRVSVVLPRHITQAIVTGAPAAEMPKYEPAKPLVQVTPQAENPVEKPEVPLPATPKPETPVVPPAPVPPAPAPEPPPQPVITEAPRLVTEQPVAPVRPPLPELPKAGRQPWQQEPAMSVPTLAHQQREINESIGGAGQSLNERLRANNIELGAMLQSSPVRDLKKAIGINDRYVFINELFRGDEAMYERSIKTINNFGNYAEAEFWIRRELKLKLAWNEEAEIVHHFDQLVKRRFS